MLEVVYAADRTEDQPGTEHDQTQVQEQQRRQQRHHLLHAVIARRGDERAQDGQRQREHGDTGAQGSQRSSFLGEEHLDFAKDDVSSLGSPFVSMARSRFNLTDSAHKMLENRVELVDSPHPCGQVASVAISRISAILLDV